MFDVFFTSPSVVVVLKARVFDTIAALAGGKGAGTGTTVAITSKNANKMADER